LILMDTDHVSVLKFQGSERQAKLRARLELSGDALIGTTIVTVEEQMRGWLNAIARERDVRRQVVAYHELAGLFSFFQGFFIALFDDVAAGHFQRLRKGKVRTATMDLKIACSALANNALLLTGNEKDFKQVPDLRFENWLD